MTNREFVEHFITCIDNGKISHCNCCPYQDDPDCQLTITNELIARLDQSAINSKYEARVKELEESNKGFIAEIEEQDRKIAYFRAVIKSIDALTDSTYNE